MTAWFTSDQHIGHANIIRLSNRPFANLEEMHRELITRHNAVVSSKDTVYHLGDFSLDTKFVRPMLSKLNGYHCLVSGNHDKCHPCHKKWQAMERKYLEFGFTTVCHDRIFTLSGNYTTTVRLNHLPYIGDSKHEARYPEHRPKDAGMTLLHGHVHEAWKINGRMHNVGVDVRDFRPVSEHELLEEILKK